MFNIMDPHIVRLIRLISLISLMYINGLNYAKPDHGICQTRLVKHLHKDPLHPAFTPCLCDAFGFHWFFAHQAMADTNGNYR